MLRINYDYINNGTKTIVFLHGWGLNGNSFNQIIESIASNVSILKIDLFGFGQSEEPKEYFDTHEYAYQIFLLLNKLNITNIILIGHSFGGRLATILSSVYDLQIDGLILTSSAGLNRFNLIKWLKIKKYKSIKKLVQLRLINQDKLLKYGSRDYKNASQVLRIVMSRVVNQDLSVFARKIQLKISYLVWDKKDKETKYWICKKLHRLIKDSKIITFQTGGHFVAFKNPRKFANLINENLIANT